MHEGGRRKRGAARSRPGARWAWTGTLAGAGLSVTANVLHARQVGQVVQAQAFSAVWPVIALLCLEVMANVRWPRAWYAWAVRWAGIGVVAGVAAWVSYRHLSGLLVGFGEETTITTFGPMAIDGLMAVCAAALLWGLPAGTAVPTAVPAVPDLVPVSVPAVPVSVPAVPVSVLSHLSSPLPFPSPPEGVVLPVGAGDDYTNDMWSSLSERLAVPVSPTVVPTTVPAVPTTVPVSAQPVSPGGTPVYIRIADEIQRRAELGGSPFSAPDKPRVANIKREFNASGTTAKRVLAELAERGLLDHADVQM